MKYFLPLIFFFTFLLADDYDPSFTPTISEKSFPIANLEGEPSAIVADCVNVITGDFFDIQRDLIMTGGEPLVLERCYSSSDTSRGSLSAGWHFNLQGMIFCDPEDQFYMLKSAFGSEFQFEDVVIGKVKFHNKMFENGFTNNAKGIISGKTNLKNYSLSIIPIDTRTYKLEKGDGSYSLFKRQRRKSKKYDKTFRLEFEQTSSGIKQNYFYDKKDRLSSFQMVNKQGATAQSLTFNYPSKKLNQTRLVVNANDGRSVEYKFSTFKSRDYKASYLREAVRPNAPTEWYLYEGLEQRDYTEQRMVEKRRLDERVLKIEYFNAGKYDNKYVSMTSPEYGRVRCLLAPVGTDSTPIITHSFHYKLYIDSKQGDCYVIDADKNKTKYSWDENLRLSSISKLNKDDQVYTIDKLYWGKDGNVGNLVSRIFASSNEPLFCKTYDYDAFGNVTTERLYGHITGKNPVPLLIDNEGKPIDTGCDCHEKTYIYSNDGRNLLLMEIEGSRSKAYRYEPDSDLVSMTFTIANGQIMERHFYTYDENCSLASEISDNGITDNPLDLSGATFRKIRIMTPRKTFPYGVPDTIEEYCQDLTTGAHCLEKALINTYTVEGRLTRQDCYDANREFRYSLFWEYNAMGNVTLESNALDQLIVRRYDANGNKIYECGPNPEYHKNFKYDFSNRLTCIEEVHADRTLSTHYTYDYLGNKTSSIDHYGNETNYIYDSFSRLKHTVAPPQFDGIRPITNISYDYLGNKAAVQDPKGNTTITYYTVKGMPNHIFHPDGTEEHFTYYINGTLEAHLDRNRCLIKYYYDYLDRPTRTEFYSPEGVLKWTTSATYDAFHLLSETDAMGNVTNYTYDVFGRKKSTSCNDSLETYDYDALGRLAKKTVFYGYESHEAIVYSYEYDLLNQIVQERTEDVFGNVILQRNKIYDCEGRVIFDTTYNENGTNTTTTHYDSHGTPVEVIDALGNVTKTIVHYDYRIGAQFVPCIEVIDPLGNVTILIKNALGQDCIHIRKNALGQITQHRTMSYDLNGNLEKVIEKVIGQESYDITHLRFYDAMNQMTCLIEASGTPEQRTTQYRYNNLGQLQSIQKPSGVFIHHAYTEEGLLARYLASDGSFHYAFGYDLNQNLIMSHDVLQGTTTLRNYIQDRLITETQATGLSVSYAYDRLGRVTAVALPDGSSIQYGYDNIHLKSITRFKKEISYQHTYDKFDISGNSLVQTLIGKAGKLCNTFDVADRLTSCITPQTSEKITAYDAVGNLLSRELSSIHYRYTYDDLYQLKSEEGVASHQYTFDSAYNRTSQDEQAIPYNHLNQRQLPGYEYDLDGRLIRTPTSLYTYDALDRLTSVTKDGITTTYTYDSFNRRLTKSEAFFLYDGQREIGCYQNGQLTEFRTLAPTESEIGSAIGIEVNNTAYVPIHDITGSVTSLLDANGNLVESYRYTAFGEEASGSSLNPWRFASKRYDAESGLIYFGNRYYDPSLGCWISPDPIGYDDGPNLYAYVSNNPLTHYDAFGLLEEERERKGISEEREESMALAREDVSDVYDNPRDYFGNSYCEWQDSSFSGSCQDFYSGFKNGVMDPTNSLLDIGRPEFLHKSHGTLAGEVFGMGVGYVAAEAFSLALTSRNFISRGFNYLRGAFNTRVAKNLQATQKITCVTSKPSQPLYDIYIANTRTASSSSVWTSTKDLNSIQNAFEHWKRHGKDFPELKNAKQYVDFARKLLKKPPSGTLEKIRPWSGDIIRYHPESNIFSVFNSHGVPKTVFKPNQTKYKTNLDYFYYGK